MNPQSGYSITTNGHCVQPSISTNLVYASAEQLPNTHENQIDTSATLCTNKGTMSPPRLSPTKPNEIPIKQEQESLYESDFIPSFPNNTGSRVCIKSPPSISCQLSRNND